MKCDGIQIATLQKIAIDHMFTNVKELCTKAVSVPVGCSDQNVVSKNKSAKA